MNLSTYIKERKARDGAFAKRFDIGYIMFKEKYMKLNDIETAIKLLSEKIDVEYELLQMYCLLVFTKKGNATLEDVHDAWSIWVKKPSEAQEKDIEYMKAINSTYFEIKKEE